MPNLQKVILVSLGDTAGELAAAIRRLLRDYYTSWLGIDEATLPLAGIVVDTAEVDTSVSAPNLPSDRSARAPHRAILTSPDGSVSEGALRECFRRAVHGLQLASRESIGRDASTLGTDRWLHCFVVALLQDCTRGALIQLLGGIHRAFYEKQPIVTTGLLMLPGLFENTKDYDLDAAGLHAFAAMQELDSAMEDPNAYGLEPQYIGPFFVFDHTDSTGSFMGFYDTLAPRIAHTISSMIKSGFRPGTIATHTPTYSACLAHEYSFARGPTCELARSQIIVQMLERGFFRDSDDSPQETAALAEQLCSRLNLLAHPIESFERARTRGGSYSLPRIEPAIDKVVRDLVADTQSTVREYRRVLRLHVVPSLAELGRELHDSALREIEGAVFSYSDDPSIGLRKAVKLLAALADLREDSRQSGRRSEEPASMRAAVAAIERAVAKAITAKPQVGSARALDPYRAELLTAQADENGDVNPGVEGDGQIISDDASSAFPRSDGQKTWLKGRYEEFAGRCEEELRALEEKLQTSESEFTRSRDTTLDRQEKARLLRRVLVKWGLPSAMVLSVGTFMSLLLSGQSLLSAWRVGVGLLALCGIGSVVGYLRYGALPAKQAETREQQLEMDLKERKRDYIRESTRMCVGDLAIEGCQAAHDCLQQLRSSVINLLDQVSRFIDQGDADIAEAESVTGALDASEFCTPVVGDGDIEAILRIAEMPGVEELNDRIIAPETRIVPSRFLRDPDGWGRFKSDLAQWVYSLLRDGLEELTLLDLVHNHVQSIGGVSPPERQIAAVAKQLRPCIHLSDAARLRDSASQVLYLGVEGYDVSDEMTTALKHSTGLPVSVLSHGNRDTLVLLSLQTGFKSSDLVYSSHWEDAYCALPEERAQDLHPQSFLDKRKARRKRNV